MTADCNQCIAIMDELMLRQPVWLQLSKTEWHSRTLSGNLGHSRELATLRWMSRQYSESETGSNSRETETTQRAAQYLADALIKGG